MVFPLTFSRRYAGLSLAGLALAIFWTAPSAVAQDTVEIEIGETALWDSNPLMLANGGEDIFGSETRGAIDLSRETESALLEAGLAAVRNQFNEASFNSSDAFLTAGFKKNTALWEASLDGAFDYDTTRSEEITTFGRNPRATRRTTWDLEPGIAYTLSPRSRVELNGAWLERRYDDSVFLTDYRTVSVSPSFIHSLSPVQTVSLSFQARRYSSLENGDRTVDSFGPSLGWQYRFRPELSLTVSAGVLGTTFDGYAASSGDWEYNPIYSGQLEYAGQRNRTVLSASRARQPFANGSEADLTTASVENRFTIRTGWSLNMKALYQKAEQPPVSTDDLDTAQEESIALVYKADDHWHFSLSQKFRREDLTNGRGDADRNIVRLGLSYGFDTTK